MGPMRNPHDNDRGLTALLGDVLAADELEAELLVRYADAPASLTAAERQQVEAQLAASPALADQLRVLRTFDPARLRVAEPNPERRRLLGALGQWWRAPIVLRWLPAGALAALGLLLLSPVIYRQVGRRVPESSPVEFRGRIERPAASDEADAAKPEEAGSDADLGFFELKRQAVPGTKKMEGPAAKPAIEAIVVPLPVYRPPADAVVRRMLKEVGPGIGQEARGGAAPAHRENAPAQLEEAKRAAPAAAPPAAGAPVVALAPADGARTVAEHPVLMWFLRETPARDVEFHLAVVDDRSGQPRGDVRLTAPTRPGVQRIRLRDRHLDLAPGTAYRWTLSMRRGAATVSATSGRIERIELPPALAAAVRSARPEERPGLYAGAGVWYDALAILNDLRERYPQNASAQAAFASLLEQGGLAEVAQSLTR
jgi:hypothetical protein